MRRNCKKNQLSTSQELTFIQEEHAKLFSEETLDLLAREHNFIQRKRKITARSFVNALVFNQEDHKNFSLLDFKCDFFGATGKHISKEALHKHFTVEAVDFLKEIFSQQLSTHLSHQSKTINSASCFFSSICIKDSTKFKLPASYLNSYPSSGGFSEKTGMMNIQYEFDILSGRWNRLELTKATRNDQTESKETLDQISKGGLYIRDLGYITAAYLKAIENNDAYYLNRLPKIGVFRLKKGRFKPLNWQALDRKIKAQKLERVELEVYLGQEKLKTRLVIAPVPKSVVDERIRKAKKGGNRTKGYQLSKEYKIKAHYNIYITNVPSEILSSNQIIEAYKLRWQVELVFKTWKSHLYLDKVKSMKKERMECQLIAKFIWILLNSKLFKAADNLLKDVNPNQGCSMAKFFKRAKKFSHTLKEKINNLQTFLDWFDESLAPIIPDLYVEQKGRKKTHCQSINDLFYA